MMTPAELTSVFKRERAKFARFNARVAGAGLTLDTRRCSPGSPCRYRDVAWCEWRGNRVYLLERVLDLPRANILGLLRHELGHLADPAIGLPHGEGRADQIAYEVTGRRIRYDRRAIQTVGRGGPRPRHLHQ